ncbi:MAG: type IX secretion system outer membrane channel protein PorV [Bacteroidota bacterium]
MKRQLSILMGILLCPSFHFCLAQTNNSGQQGVRTITTAVPFLTLAPDARAGAMGESGVATADDANAVHWNPATISFFKGSFGVSTSFVPWLRNIKIQNVLDPRFGKSAIPDLFLSYTSAYYNLGERAGTIFGSFRYFNYGEIEFTDGLGQPIGTDTPLELAVDVGYTRKLAEKLSAGLSFRYIRSRLAVNPSFSQANFDIHAVAADISLFYLSTYSVGSNGLTLQTGLNLSNIGPKVSYTDISSDEDFLPVNLRLGYALTLAINELHAITFTNDFNKLLVPSEGGSSDKGLIEGMLGSFSDAENGFSEELSEINFSLGLEYQFMNMVAARGGFFHEDPFKGDRKFFTVGLGGTYRGFSLDVSLLLFPEEDHPLDNTLRFTLAYDLTSTMRE